MSLRRLPVFALMVVSLLLLPDRPRAQPSGGEVQGLREQTPRWHALVGARLVLAPGQVIESGTLVMREGRIVAVGPSSELKPPVGARVWQLPGRSVYAGFIDMALASPIKPRTPAGPGAWVQAEASQARQLEGLHVEDLKPLRELGFTSALLSPSKGVFRGSSALIQLGLPGEGSPRQGLLLAGEVAQHLAHEFERGERGRYPNSLMGAIALVRQTWWNARAQQPGAEDADPRLAALAPALSGRQPVVYQADDEQDYARIARIRDEFGLRVILQGNGHEYRQAELLRRLAMPLIVPLNYPAVPEIESDEQALDVPLHSLQHWERAPSNLALLQQAGLEFAVSSQGLREPAKEFWPRLRQAVRRGLPADAALAALSTVPARLLGQSGLGRLAVGQRAQVVVASGDLFRDEAAEIELSFVDGSPMATEAFERFDVRGRWSVQATGVQATGEQATGEQAKGVPAKGEEPPAGSPGSSIWTFSGSASRPVLALGEHSCKPQLRGRELLVPWPCGGPAAADGASTLLLSGRGDLMQGSLSRPDGSQQRWTARRLSSAPAGQDSKAEVQESKAEAALPPWQPTRPAGVFGLSAPPERPAVLLIRNASIWTSAAAGRMDGADLLVRDGKIAAIGRQLPAPADAQLIEAAGRHLTPGLIDAHSHTAIALGINEASHSVTAEVRVGDVLDATDINIYRQLMGGVTSAHLLHGSANTIGGQSQLIKLRWGEDAEALKFAGAMPGIKFALGENVKQSNWGEGAKTRYPQSRMGVEQLLRDRFQAAREYRAARAAWRKAPKAGPEPRRDLQLDILVELLERRRLIHIHSYRADEILMFSELARGLGLDVATFQHVLEGYKVAPEIRGLGAGASTFSDWWAYKMEVQDAIPYNGAMMARAGVLTSFNSDSDELARRLNTEAAKAVRYGGLDEQEALKFVTLNPARQLRVADRVGSLEVGKDADFVIWSAHPLSSAARAEQTWIDGRRYFDLASDARLRERDRLERQRLIAKALPLRMAASRESAKDGGKEAAGAPSTASTPLADLLQHLSAQRWLHQQGLYRHSYWDGGERHECTQDGL